MKEIKLLHKTPNDILDIVREMRKTGLVQGKDFDFSYAPASYNNDGWEAVEPRKTVFVFYTEKWATWFVLKWAT